MIYDQPPAPIIVCLDCSPHERIALNFLQEKRKIKNINALAVVMGNIKQESKFDNLVCEGGQRTGYKKCNSGGFGLIQWTTTARYIGLGKFCAKYDLNLHGNRTDYAHDYVNRFSMVVTDHEPYTMG